MTSVYRWSPADKARLLACTTEAEMARAFPDKTLGNLLRRRTEFAKSNPKVKAKTSVLERPRFDTELTELKPLTFSPKVITPEPSSWTPSAADKQKTHTITHVVIPDTQAGPGRPTDHLRWIGQYIVDQFAGRKDVKIIHLGDHADFPSLSSYDKGKKSMENRRVMEDIAAANHAFDILNEPLNTYNKGRGNKWLPERHITLGNHEDRLTRAVEGDAQMEGLLSLDMLNYKSHDWQVHDFLKPVNIDGIYYSHFFANPMSGKPYGGMAATRLKTLGTSYTQGHQQTLDYSIRFVGGKSQHGLVAGACYTWDENYKGFQGNAHWRGIVICHDVHEGSYDPLFLSLAYLCRRYESMEIEVFMKKKYGVTFNGGW